jgi:hypothetical protein
VGSHGPLEYCPFRDARGRGVMERKGVPKGEASWRAGEMVDEQVGGLVDGWMGEWMSG